MSVTGVRVTVINASGQVLADSQVDSRTMENHGDRPEIRAALAQGEGQSLRRSVTLQHDLLYHAIRQDAPSGEPLVLRFALPLQTSEAALAIFPAQPVAVVAFNPGDCRRRDTTGLSRV